MLYTLEFQTVGSSPNQIRFRRNGRQVQVTTDNTGYLAAGSYSTGTRPIAVGARITAVINGNADTSNMDCHWTGNIYEILIYKAAVTALKR